MEYIKIAKVSDFSSVSMKTYRILARHIGVFKEADGSFRAMEMGCKHEHADLSKGEIKGDIVTCHWHGWKYNLRTGECLWGAKTRLRPYGVKVENENIFVTLSPLEEGEEAC